MPFVDCSFPECTVGLKYEATVMEDEAVSTLDLFFLLF